MKTPVLRGEVAAVLAAALWGFNYPLVKMVLRVVPESQFLLLRFTATVALLFLYLTLSGEGLKVRREHVLPVLVLGVVGVGLYNILWTYGIHRTTAATAALLISTSPIFTGLYSMLTRTERITTSRWVGTVLAFLGIYLVISGTPGSQLSFGSEAFLGNLLMLTGALFFSFYALMAKPLLRCYSSVKLTALAMAGGLLVLVPLGLSPGMTPGSSRVAPWVWFGLTYVVVCGTIVAFALWYEGIKQTSPVRTVLFHYLVPVVSMAVGCLFLKETVTGKQLLGAVLVLLGLIVVKRDTRSRAAQSPSPQSAAAQHEGGVDV